MFGWLMTSLLPALQVGMMGIDPATANSLDKTIKTKILILGGGPAGLSAAIGAAKAEYKPVVIEGSLMLGAANKAGKITNYPGLPDLTGPEIVQKLKEQAKQLGAQLYPEEKVVSCNFKAHPFILETNKGQKFIADSVLIATGTNPRKLNIPGETKFEGKGVVYCSSCDGPLFKDRSVVIIGNDHNALRELSTLKKFAKDITIITEKAEFDAPKFLLNLLDLPNVKVIKNAKAKEIMGTDKVTSVKALMDNGEMEAFPTQGVFIALGWKPHTEIFKDQIKLDNKDRIVVSYDTFETSVPGVFAAGECSTQGKHQMPSASGTGYTTYLSLEQYLKKLEKPAS